MRSILVILLAGGVAYADPSIDTVEPTADQDLGDQGIGADVGIAAGGRVTPGGLRVAGHYLYQLSDRDWFDGTAAFTFGGGGAACSRDQMDTLSCDHGFTAGRSVQISASVRRMFAAQGAFRPFARAGVGVSLVQFAADDVSGVAVPLHVGGGIRARVAPAVAIVAQGELELGLGRFGNELGIEPQVGVAFTAGAEFRLK
jgi:opacity protein-like surface antigen